MDPFDEKIWVEAFNTMLKRCGRSPDKIFYEMINESRKYNLLVDIFNVLTLDQLEIPFNKLANNYSSLENTSEKRAYVTRKLNNWRFKILNKVDIKKYCLPLVLSSFYGSGGGY